MSFDDWRLLAAIGILSILLLIGLTLAYRELSRCGEKGIRTAPGRGIVIAASASGALTSQENNHIASRFRCPDCKEGRLCRGPEGGLAVNVMCETCHSEFNLTLFDGCCWGERISPPGPRPAGDRGWRVYGIRDQE